jgi:transcriptional regulator with XRE-family HTH domain
MEDLGRRLRRVRELNGVSQRQLARRSGVSNATISLIEHDRTSPSLGILKRILDAVPISISEFFALELPADSQVVYRAAEMTELADGAVSYRQVGRDLSQRRLQIMVERYAPGADTGRAALSHDGEEGGVVQSGRLELTVEDQTWLLGPGDAYLFSSRLPHRFRNPGAEDCVLVSACTPPSF